MPDDRHARRRARATLPGLAAAALTLSLAAPTSAAGPTAADCAAANKQSTKAATEHLLRQARDQANICSAASCSATIRAACKKRSQKLTATIPTIIFTAKDSSGQLLTNVKVSMDGESLADHLDGTGLAVDPGQHTFSFEIAGQPPVERPFTIKEGQKDRREDIAFPAPPPPPAPAAPVEVAASGAPAGGAADADAGTPGARRPLRTVGIVIGGVGLASLAAGGVTGVVAISKSSAAQTACASATQCKDHAAAVSDHSTAASMATVSTVTFIAGGALLAAGVTLFFVAPASRPAGDAAPAQAAFVRVDPLIGPGTGGLQLEGVF